LISQSASFQENRRDASLSALLSRLSATDLVSGISAG
jgi:hypothetical protein